MSSEEEKSEWIEGNKANQAMQDQPVIIKLEPKQTTKHNFFNDQQDNGITIKKKNKIHIKWDKYVRNIVKIAVIVLIIIFGFNFVKETYIKSKSANQNSITSMSGSSSKSGSSKGSSSTNSSSGNQSQMAGAAGMPNSSSVSTTKSESNSNSTSNSSLTASTDSSQAEKSQSTVSDTKVALTDSQAASSSNTQGTASSTQTISSFSNSASSNVNVKSGSSSGSSSTGIVSNSDTAGKTDTKETTGGADASGAADPSDNSKTSGDTTAQNDSVGTASIDDSNSEGKFTKIFPVDVKQVKSIKITKESDKTLIAISTQEDIKNFYSVMNKYQYSTNRYVSLTSDYTIKFESQDGITYTLDVSEDSITISYTKRDKVNRSFYLASQEKQLLSSLDEFCKKYGN